MPAATVKSSAGVGRKVIFDPNSSVSNIKGASSTALKTIALVNDVIAALQALAPTAGGALSDELTMLANQLQGASTAMSNAVAGM